MSGGARACGLGLLAAIALALPAALVGQILDAVLAAGLPDAAAVPLAAVVLAAAGVGGWVAGRHRPPRRLLVGAVVGAAALAVVTGLGVARRVAGGEEAQALVVPAGAAWGAALGATGAALGGRPARTRP